MNPLPLDPEIGKRTFRIVEPLKQASRWQLLTRNGLGARGLRIALFPDPGATEIHRPAGSLPAAIAPSSFLRKML